MIHDISVQNLDVTFGIDRSGIVGADGPTHQGAFDMSFLRCVPNMVLLAPSNESECRDMLYTAFLYNGPAAVRYPRGSGPGEVESAEMRAIPIGKGVVKRTGTRVALLAFGTMVNPALTAGVELDATVVNMRSVKPMDNELILKMAESHEIIVSIEENTVNGGAGAGVAEVLSAAGCTTPILILGLPDHHVDQGETGSVLSSLGLDSAGIVASVRKRISLKATTSR